jgi:hypothetical protein
MYTCVNNGCPSTGADEMKCKEGFKSDSPLCAVCDVGHFKSARDCKRCDHPRVGLIAGLVAGVLVVLVVIRLLVQKYQRYLNRAAAFSHLKVVVSFMTVAVTLDTQFGE